MEVQPAKPVCTSSQAEEHLLSTNSKMQYLLLESFLLSIAFAIGMASPFKLPLAASGFLALNTSNKHLILAFRDAELTDTLVLTSLALIELVVSALTPQRSRSLAPAPTPYPPPG